MRPSWRIPALVLTGILIAALAGLAVAQAVSGHRSASPPPGPTTVPAPTTAPTTAPPVTAGSSPPPPPTTAAVGGARGGPVPSGFEPQSVSFVSASLGWVLGAAPCASPPCTSVVRTSDGARSWAGVPAPRVALADSPSQASGVSGLRFANHLDGWAFGPALWSTHDGAASWDPIELPAAGPGTKVVDLSVSGSSVYALAVSPGQGASSQGGQSTAQLFASPVASDRWSPVSGVIAPTYAGGQVVTHGGAAWVTIGPGPGGAHYWTSPDGKAFTEQAAPPCAQGTGASVLAASSPGELVLVCGGSGGLGQQAKPTYVSSDGGRTFTAVSDPPNGGDLNGVATPNPSVAVVAASSGASELYATFDGGRSWHTVLSDTASGGAPWHDLGFTTATQGVVVEGFAAQATPAGAGSANAASRLWGTTDGGHTWKPLAFRG